MRLTIDASVAVKWFIAEARHERARDVIAQGHELVAPDLILVEVANALRNKVRNGLADKTDMARGLAELPSLFEPLLVARDLLSDAFELACQINHPVADCVYISCARKTGSPLLTDDTALHAKAKSLLGEVSVELLGNWKSKA